MMARWIRLGALGQREFDAAYASIAIAQARSAAPVLLWSEEAARYPFALIAPLKFAPGGPCRWLSWGLASPVGTSRQFGGPAYPDGELDSHRPNIAESRGGPLGEVPATPSP